MQITLSVKYRYLANPWSSALYVRRISNSGSRPRIETSETPCDCATPLSALESFCDDMVAGSPIFSGYRLETADHYARVIE